MIKNQFLTIANLATCAFLALLAVSPAMANEGSPGASSSGASLDSEMARGQELFFGEQFEQAEAVFQKCYDQNPQSADATSWLAKVKAYRLGERAKRGESKLSLIGPGREVQQLYTKAYELDPDNPRAQIGYAILLRDVPGMLGGDLDKAESILEGLLQKDPTNVLACHHLGNLYIRKKDNIERGLYFLKRAVEVSQMKEMTPEEAFYINRTYHAIGETYLEEKEEPAEAVEYLKQALELDNQHANAMIDLAEAYRQLDQEAEAREALKVAARFCKENEYKFFYSDLRNTARKLDMEKEINL